MADQPKPKEKAPKPWDEKAFFAAKEADQKKRQEAAAKAEE